MSMTSKYRESLHPRAAMLWDCTEASPWDAPAIDSRHTAKQALSWRHGTPLTADWLEDSLKTRSNLP